MDRNSRAPRPLRILVVGAGVGGISSARALLADGHEVTVFERRPNVRAAGGAVTIWPNGATVLDRLSVDTAGAGQALSTLRVTTSGGRRIASYDLGSVAARLGAPVRMIPRRVLLERLLEGFPAERIRCGKRLSALRRAPGGLRVEFDDGSSAEGDVVIGADGLHSKVREIVGAYDFGAHHTIVDVGGGQGSLLAAILAAAPASRGILYDVPGVLTGAPKLLRDNGIVDRVRIVEGSFFDAVPGGADAYVLKNIIHDWPDDRAVRILRNVRAAAAPGAAVLLVEMVIGEHRRDFPGNWADLEMLLNLGARERTAREYRELLRQAGFRTTRVVHTASPLSVIEARAG